jgi:hypothetical protein
MSRSLPNAQNLLKVIEATILELRKMRVSLEEIILVGSKLVLKLEIKAGLHMSL